MPTTKAEMQRDIENLARLRVRTNEGREQVVDQIVRSQALIEESHQASPSATRP